MPCIVLTFNMLLLALGYMHDQDDADDLIIGRYIDETALASAIKNKLYNHGDAARCQTNIHGHVIERYISRPGLEQGEKTHSSKDRRPPYKNKAASHGNAGRLSRQSPRDHSGNDVSSRSDPDLMWLDEPQTLYLKKKLHVHDSVTFAGHLAHSFSSSCVRDAIKKVKLVYELIASADKVQYPVFAIDCGGKVIAWNKAMEQLTDTTADEMIGKGNYAYAVPLYGIARPMLIDYLVLPSPRADNASGEHLIGKDDIITSKKEMVWLQGGPRIIQGWATRIHDEEGVVVGAIQSIGIHEPSDAIPQFGGKSAAHEISMVAGSDSTPRSADKAISPRITRISDTGVYAGSGTDITPGIVRDPESTEQVLAKRHGDLHHAPEQLMATEENLLNNIGTLTHSPQLVFGQEKRSGDFDELSRRVIMDAREGIIVFDSELRCILWNTFMEQLTGLSSSEVRGERAFDMFPALRGSYAYLLLQQALSGKMVESSDISLHIPLSGKQAWVRLIFSALHDSSGKITGVIGIVQDTTARKVMEYALQSTIVQLMESEEKYHSVFNAKNDPLLIIDTSTRRILDLNDAASDMYGYMREEFLALPLANLFMEPEKYEDLLERQATGIRMYRQRRKDGTIFPADVSFAYFELRGNLVLLLSIRDLSSARETAEALRLANTKLNLLIGVTRHDMINNLTALMGYNDLLKHTVRDTQVLAVLEKEESALQTLHRQIEFTRQYYNLGVKSPIWQNVCDISTRAYSQFITTISFTCDTCDLEVYADPLLEKVFYNLIDNAIHHGESVFRIRIYCVREGADLLLIFGDDGEGIPPENKERIFKRGFGKHTGLGLFLSREILAITRIDISEVGEFEKGARFEFRIPSGHYRFSDSENPQITSESEKMNLAI
jgi:PAS domain S-box-containing protein